jgi:N-acetylmuramate 1-kinase
MTMRGRFSAAKCPQNTIPTPHFTNQAAVIANQSNNKSSGLSLSETDFAESSPRFAALLIWVARHIGAEFNIQKASEDASFRRYFRVSAGAKTWIVMDAPPEREKCAPFVRIADMFAQAGLHAPHIAAQDLELGFLLLEDLGRSTYLQGLAAILNPDPELENVAQNKLAHSLFVDAIDALVQWQLCSKPDVLPPYDEAVLRREIQLFPDWYVAKHRNIVLSPAHQKIVTDAFTTIVQRNLNQAQVFVHRDFMPGNLMICPAAAPHAEFAKFANPGILDFQDALYGPISYDIAALFKDAFISWKEEQILDWTIRYWEKARKAKLPVPADFSEFYADCEWMALQRHLKILGLFARINYRDGKPDYLADTPRFIAYVRHTCDRYRALGPLLTVIDHVESTAPADVGYTF